MAPFLPVRAISRSQAVRIGKKNLSKESGPGKGLPTVYVDINPEGSNSVAYTALKELRQHLAIGAVVVVGPITNSNVENVVTTGFTTAETKAENDKEYLAKISSGTLLNRATGVYTEQAAAQETAKVKGAKTGKEKKDRIEVKNSTGAIKVTAGTEANEEKAALPAETEGYTTVATVTTINEKIEATPSDFKVVDTRPRP